MTPLDYYLLGAIKDKCYADKPETIDALKDNIREDIGEIQLHTIDNVLKNWFDRVDYCMAIFNMAGKRSPLTVTASPCSIMPLD